MKQQQKDTPQGMPEQAPRRILGRAVGRQISVEETTRIAGGWDQSSPDPSGTMPFQAGGEWSYGDWNPV